MVRQADSHGTFTLPTTGWAGSKSKIENCRGAEVPVLEAIGKARAGKRVQEYDAPSALGQRKIAASSNPSRRWVSRIGLAAAVGVSYFLIAYLSIGLMVTDAYSFFWPAAGIATGVLIALGPAARWPVVAGVACAVIVLNVLKYAGMPNAIAVTLVNSGEPVIVALLIQRYVGNDFSLDRVSHLAALAVSALIACAAFAIGWAIVLKFSLGLPILKTWLKVTENDAIGIVLVAPQ